MTEFEIHYQKGTEYGETIVSAEYPEQARQKFLLECTDKNVVVLCVLRHNIDR